MPAEIADSDAESEFSPPSKQPSLLARTTPVEPSAANDAIPSSALERDPLNEISFSQFLSPTQRLSSVIAQEDAARQSQSTSSTNRCLLDQLPHHERYNSSLDAIHVVTESSSSSRPSELCVVKKKGRKEEKRSKRRFSEIEDTPRAQRPSASESMPSKRIRAHHSSKTSHSSREGTPHSEPQLPTEALNEPQDEQRSQVAEQSIGESTLGAANVEHEKRHHSGFAQNHMLGKSSAQKTGTTGYQGFMLQGIDVHANPFGSLSQVSLEDGLPSAEAAKFKNIFKMHEERNVLGAVAKGDSSEDLAMDLRSDATSRWVDRAVENHPPQSGPEDEGRDSRKEDTCHEAEPAPQDDFSNSQEPTAAFVEMDVERTAPRKRGRTQKNGRQRENCERNREIHLKPRPSKSRATVVEFSEANEGQSEKHSHRAKKRKTSISLDELGDVPAKNSSSDLGLNSPSKVGAPREIYLAKPSRSRSKSVHVVDAEDAPFLKAEDGKAVASESLSQTSHAIRSPPVDVSDPPNTTKRKRTPKGKSKQKKSAPIPICSETSKISTKEANGNLGDESEAVEINSGMVGTGATDTTQAIEQDQENMGVARSPMRNKKKISIDIPSLPNRSETIAIAKPEPKKRGRKPKQKADIHVEAPADDAHIEHNHPAERKLGPETEEEHATPCSKKQRTRSPLSEKDPNIGRTFVAEAKETHATPLMSRTFDLLPSKDESEERATKAATPLVPTRSISSSTLAATATDALIQRPAKSPLKSATSSSNPSFNTKPRVGLSRTHRIPSLLRKLDRNKEPPRVQERKEKLTKKQQEAEEKRRLELADAAEDANGNNYDDIDIEARGYDGRGRGRDGMLVEWDD